MQLIPFLLERRTTVSKTNLGRPTFNLVVAIGIVYSYWEEIHGFFANGTILDNLRKLSESTPLIISIPISAFLAMSIIALVFSVIRKSKKTTQSEEYDEVLANTKLTKEPKQYRSRYSDRMSYILAEMSELAYRPVSTEFSQIESYFRGSSKKMTKLSELAESIQSELDKGSEKLTDLVKSLNKIAPESSDKQGSSSQGSDEVLNKIKEEISKLVKSGDELKSAKELVSEMNENSKKIVNQTDAIAKKVKEDVGNFVTELLKKTAPDEYLATTKTLKEKGFQLKRFINVGSTQGLIIKREEQDDKKPYYVIAFRGTQELNDFLLDAKVKPKKLDGRENEVIHEGFWGGYDEFIKKYNDDLKEIKDSGLPVFITGHSLGGALAMITTKEYFPDIEGACYTFGAPMVANYDFFRCVKTPVYRVVNSSDIVPRLPSGFLIRLIISILNFIRDFTKKESALYKILSRIFARLVPLGLYKHYGDLRYLTDVAVGQFDKTRLLNNPNSLDRLLWFGESLKLSFGRPIKSHGLKVYRKKLEQVALDRFTE